MLSCPVCDKVFRSTKQLVPHLKSHANENPFTTQPSKPRTRKRSSSTSTTNHRNRTNKQTVKNESSNNTVEISEVENDTKSESTKPSSLLRAILSGNPMSSPESKTIVTSPESKTIVTSPESKTIVCNQTLKSTGESEAENIVFLKRRYTCVFCQKAFVSKMELQHHYESHTAIKDYISIAGKKGSRDSGNSTTTHCKTRRKNNSDNHTSGIIVRPRLMSQNEKHKTGFDEDIFTKTSAKVSVDDYASKESSVGTLFTRSKQKAAPNELSTQKKNFLLKESQVEDDAMLDTDHIKTEVRGKSTVTKTANHQEHLDEEHPASSSSKDSQIHSSELCFGSLVDILQKGRQATMAGTHEDIGSRKSKVVEGSATETKNNDFKRINQPHHNTIKELRNYSRPNLIHAREKPFICPVCKEEFNIKANMLGHFKIHAKEIFKCAVCPKFFTIRRHLILHQLRSHNIPTLCFICGRCSRTAEDFQQHSKTCHKDQLSTLNDLESFPTEDSDSEIIFNMDEEEKNESEEALKTTIKQEVETIDESNTQLQTEPEKELKDRHMLNVLSIQMRNNQDGQNVSPSSINTHDTKALQNQNEVTLINNVRGSVKLECSDSSLEDRSDDFCETTELDAILPDDGPVSHVLEDQTSNLRIERIESGIPWLASPGGSKSTTSVTSTDNDLLIDEEKETTDDSTADSSGLCLWDGNSKLMSQASSAGESSKMEAVKAGIKVKGKSVDKNYYAEYRRKNNIASRRSRLTRHIKNRQVEKELEAVIVCNLRLKDRVRELDRNVENTKRMIIELVEAHNNK